MPSFLDTMLALGQQQPQVETRPDPAAQESVDDDWKGRIFDIVMMLAGQVGPVGSPQGPLGQGFRQFLIPGDVSGMGDGLPTAKALLPTDFRVRGNSIFDILERYRLAGEMDEPNKVLNLSHPWPAEWRQLQNPVSSWPRTLEDLIFPGAFRGQQN